MASLHYKPARPTGTAAGPTAGAFSSVSPIAVTSAVLHPPSHWTTDPTPGDNDDDSTLGDDSDLSTASLTSSIMHYREVNGRTYHSDCVANDYWGANDERQNSSLDIGHHGMILLLGGKLHLAPLPEQIDTAIDIGTGTGIWAADFAEEHGDTTVIGTDISPIQPAWVPPNLSFQIEDFTRPWTLSSNSADYVHSRWLNGAVVDWNAFMNEAYRVLKPGGWVESFDYDCCIFSDNGSVTPDSAVALWTTLFLEGARRMGLRASFRVSSEGLQRNAITNAGFVNIVEKDYKVPMSEWPEDPNLKQVGLFWRAAATNDIEGMMQLMATQLGWSPTEINVFAAHMRQELRQLKNQHYFFGKIVYAQKPLK